MVTRTDPIGKYLNVVYNAPGGIRDKLGTEVEKFYFLGFLRIHS